MFFAGAVCAADDPLIWRIGTKDNSYSEFVTTGGTVSHATLFPNGASFEVGKSDPAKDWAFIQPGPADAWAGNRQHESRITFAMANEPSGSYILELDLVDAHGMMPPSLSISVNDREQQFSTAAGPGDGSLTDPKAGREQRLNFVVDGRYLRQGANTVVIKTLDGSWIIYDAVSFSALTDAVPKIDAFSVSSTCLFKKVSGKLRQVVRASIEVYRDCELVRLRLRSEKGWQVEQTYRNVESGLRQLEIDVPPVKSREKIHVKAYIGGDVFETEGVIEPSRLWKVYLLPSSHFDLGYSAPQDQVLALHRDNMDRALAWMREYPGLTWNLEGAYLAEDYLKNGSKPAEFLRAAKAGKIGVQGFFGNELTGICSSEALVRLLDYYDQLRKTHGFASGCVMETDVPSMVWTVPMILRGHGIRYLSHGINATRARGDQTPYETPYWWQSPDGSKVLVWKAPGYGWVSQITSTGIQGNMRMARQQVESMLGGYARRPNYPFDAILLHGGYGDNCPNVESLPKVIAEWNRTYEYPKLICCRGSEYFEYVERKFAKHLTTVSGDGGVWWEDGAGSSAYETAIAREAERNLVAAEKLTALCDEKFQRQVKPLFEEAWRNALLYDEHTWGAAGSISHANDPGTLKQWAVKKEFADKASEQAKSLLAKTAQQAGYKIAEEEVSAEPVAGGEPVVENRYYRVSIDPATGAVTSIFDKELKRELLTASGYGANRYLYVTGGGGSVEGQGQPATDLKIGTCEGATARKRSSDKRQEIEITCKTSAGEDLTSRLVLWNDRKQIDFENQMDKKATTAKEAGYFAFPFAFAKPEIRVEIPNGVIRPDVDQFKAACRDWYAVQDFLTISDGKAEVVFVPWDSPLVTLQDINRGQWYERLPIENGNVFAYVFNNYWFTNYKASQGGPLRFRFSITSGKSFADSQAKRFAQEVLAPVRVAPASVDAGNVVVQAVKPARFAEGTIVRLREMDGKAGSVRLTARVPFKKAYLCNLAEDKIKELRVTGGDSEIPTHQLLVPCPALGLATVLLER